MEHQFMFAVLCTSVRSFAQKRTIKNMCVRVSVSMLILPEFENKAKFVGWLYSKFQHNVAYGIHKCIHVEAAQ